MIRYRHSSCTFFTSLLLTIFWLFSQYGLAEIYQANTGNYRSLLDGLAPGDTLRLDAGDYQMGLPIEGLNGAEETPIIISGPDDGPPAVFWARECCNTVSINNSSYVEIRNLEINRQGLPAEAVVDAVKAEGTSQWAHHITLENLRIYNYGNHQQAVGISTKCPAWNWVIRRNAIYGAGTGMYLGNDDGRDPFVNSVIENNLIVDSIGYNLEIKHQNDRPSVKDMPRSGTTVIRHNTFSKQNKGALGDNARPNLLVGHWPPSGDGSADTYQIYGNFFYENPTGEALFQGEGNIALYNNLFVNSSGPAIHIQRQYDSPRMIRVFNNTVVANGNGIRVSGGDPIYDQKVVANAVFAQTPIVAYDTTDNITDAYEAAGDYLADPYSELGQMDLYPQKGSLVGSFIDREAFEDSYWDWDIDFNGDEQYPEPGVFRGAYAGEGANPGWRPQLEIKP
ncbi:MAG: right-handed parallel beta-helix repeat-containing protein [Acidobacteria bacterium]|nr:right-handed parallel beta-helix repeat-containing protein [Acidobacteriota bacterium]MBI3655691.1 right-handed parallel beta-helix repeat-containing protein [Acidobacteriota bacterium]